MKKRHYRDKLSDFVDQQLSGDERQLVGEHLLVCDQCRREHDSIRLAASLAARLDRVDAPDRVWRAIESELDGTAPHVTIIPDARTFTYRKAAAFAAAVVIVGLFAGVVYRGLFVGDHSAVVRHGEPPGSASPEPASGEPGWPANRNDATPEVAEANPATASPSATDPGTGDHWEVQTLAGRPQIASGDGRLSVGSYLVTDAASRARIEVANIGTVDVQPNSRIRLVGTSEKEHRLSLERGALHARIAAPPRLFIVDTPSAVAVDLGCEYTLEVDAKGNNRLHVTSGFVALERDGRESIVPAGAMCLTQKGKGLGTPFAADTSEAFRKALERFDFFGGGTSAVETMLANKNFYDIISLWHLLSRVQRADREKVFDALAAYVAPPAGVTREGVMKLDRKMLEAWRSEVEAAWFE
jgi:anti-sigma factor RsiW